MSVCSCGFWSVNFDKEDPQGERVANMPTCQHANMYIIIIIIILSSSNSGNLDLDFKTDMAFFMPRRHLSLFLSLQTLIFIDRDTNYEMTIAGKSLNVFSLSHKPLFPPTFPSQHQILSYCPSPISLALYITAKDWFSFQYWKERFRSIYRELNW